MTYPLHSSEAKIETAEKGSKVTVVVKVARLNTKEKCIFYRDYSSVMRTRPFLTRTALVSITDAHGQSLWAANGVKIYTGNKRHPSKMCG